MPPITDPVYVAAFIGLLKWNAAWVVAVAFAIWLEGLGAKHDPHRCPRLW